MSTPLLSAEEVVARIRALAVEHGRPPRQRDRGAPVHPAIRIFGDWGSALEAAGFPRPALAVQKREGGPRTAAILNQPERAAYGFTATIREQAGGRIETCHRVGPPLATLKAFMVELDERSADEGSDWRLLCYSTPNTIFGDLLVSRDGRAEQSKGAKQGIEALVLARVGRIDRLDPSLERPWSRKNKAARRGGERGHAWRKGGAGYMRFDGGARW
jgi:HNH endonuclease